MHYTRLNRLDYSDLWVKTLICAMILPFIFVIPARAAAQVAAGCYVPSATPKNVWYVDPVNGKTQAAGGNGSKSNPWNSLSAIFNSVTGYTVPMLSTVPYRHINPATNTYQVWTN